MARKYYRKKYYKKTKWSSNIQNINSVVQASSEEFSNSATLITNPVQNVNSVSQIFTVKNVHLSFNLESANQINLNRTTAYIMFVPQGMTVGENYALSHPEYIMAMKYFGSVESSEDNNRNPLSISTRLARKLNTGDSIILYINGFNIGVSSLQYNIFGVVRWWTKAN